MKGKVYIVEVSTRCPYNKSESHVFSQEIFNYSNKAFDYWKNLIKSKVSELNLTYYYDKEPPFEELKEAFIKKEASMQVVLCNREILYYIDIYMKELKKDTKV